MTKVNPNYRNETKSDIFSWNIFKSDTLSLVIKNIRVFQWLSKSNFLSFMTTVNPNIEMKQNQTFFYGTYSNLNLASAFIISIFQFHYKSENKQVKWNEIQRDMCKCDSIFRYLQRGTLLKYLIDFWNLFLDKVYLKNKW